MYADTQCSNTASAIITYIFFSFYKDLYGNISVHAYHLNLLFH